MAPEVARGDQLSAKADVWSSCCMLLHMLNGCQPWIRYYSHPLCLQPPPLWEVPSNCNNFTAKVFKAGLQKDPERRASAKELQRKTTKALRADVNVCVHIKLLYTKPILRFVSVLKDSDRSSDDLSSGIFSSCNSQTDGHMEWSASANQPSSYCSEGKMSGVLTLVSSYGSKLTRFKV
uniref:Protein kinase domain-containing protein n=1 Tax=Amphiprion percula TaxID=161767 RepID=A0A3P8RX78_AMPPE